MSSISPDLHGDIKSDFNFFLLEPVSRLSLSNSKVSRNFWIYINPDKIWSATGVSKEPNRLEDKFTLEAGLLWQKITRQNKKIGLKAEITSFIPSTGEPIELMLVDITNISGRPVKFTPTAAIPLFARSANNLHDHRHVTSLLERIEKTKFGIIVKPTLIFDESGHRKSEKSGFVFGADEGENAAQYIYPTQAEFTGENSDLEAPDAIFNNLLPQKNSRIQGKEAIGALRFKAKLLKPKESASYIIVMGIADDGSSIAGTFKKFNSRSKVQEALEKNKASWQRQGCQIRINTPDKAFDNWVQWVNIQPVLRRIFGCSYLPDFDYGKGGRGWRDLWQDCLSLILNNPKEARQLLINNFCGVRIDGSNATIIGKEPGEFIADRNNLSRVWMDHGAWPLITTHLYIHQTSDLDILFEEAPYFRDHQLSRSREIDSGWAPEYGKKLKTKNKDIYQGSILEHILVENLVQFFNVGPHNHILLEGADWNDGLDMAPDYGESVAFSALYAQNLRSLSEILERLAQDRITVLKELSLLLDSLTASAIDYSDINAKRKRLEEYFQNVKYEVSGEKISLSKTELISDLKKKVGWMYAHIRNSEWLKEGFFNGYYNNDEQRVEGNFNGTMRMTLTGQVFPVMSGIATPEQTKELTGNVRRYLKDRKLGGLHLNTDFSRLSFKISGGIPPKAGKEEQLNLGRAFSFVYGDKENGAIFSHMAVMYGYALYKQGFVKEGYEAISALYKMAVDTAKSRIYPCLPEYFNAEGRGMYSYLTGSASWFLFTLLTQAFGIRGEYGDLVIEPKLTAEQFKNKNIISINTSFADKQIEVRFVNPRKKDFGAYSVTQLTLNAKTLCKNLQAGRFFMPRREFLSLAGSSNVIEITLD